MTVERVVPDFSFFCLLPPSPGHPGSLPALLHIWQLSDPALLANPIKSVYFFFNGLFFCQVTKAPLVTEGFCKCHSYCKGKWGLSATGSREGKQKNRRPPCTDNSEDLDLHGSSRAFAKHFCLNLRLKETVILAQHSSCTATTGIVSRPGNWSNWKIKKWPWGGKGGGRMVSSFGNICYSSSLLNLYANKNENILQNWEWPTHAGQKALGKLLFLVLVLS